MNEEEKQKIREDCAMRFVALIRRPAHRYNTPEVMKELEEIDREYQKLTPNNSLFYSFGIKNILKEKKA